MRATGPGSPLASHQFYELTELARVPFVVRNQMIIIRDTARGSYPRGMSWSVEWSISPKPGEEDRIALLAPFPENALVVDPQHGQSFATGGNRGRVYGPGRYEILRGEYPETHSTSVGGHLILWGHAGSCDCTSHIFPAHVTLPFLRSVLPGLAFFARITTRVGIGNSIIATVGAQLGIPARAVWIEAAGITQPIVSAT